MMFVNESPIFYNGFAAISVGNWKMVILVIALLHRLMADSALTICASENFCLLFLIEGTLRVETNTNNSIHLFTPKAVMLCNFWPGC